MPGTHPPTPSAIWRRSGVAFRASELAVCGGIRLARMAKSGCLALAEDGERLETLLAIGYSAVARTNVCTDRGRGGGLTTRRPCLGQPASSLCRPAAARCPRRCRSLEAAAWLLDTGVSPQTLMKELGLQSRDVELRRYDPDQPRVPAGSGRESGRWSGGVHGAEGVTIGVDGRAQSRPVEGNTGSRLADGPFHPRGITVVPLAEPDPLDPKGLNKPLGPAEQQAIADIVNTIVGARAEDLSILRPHPYKNLQHEKTGAQLPPSIKYRSSYVRSAG